MFVQSMFAPCRIIPEEPSANKCLAADNNYCDSQFCMHVCCVLSIIFVTDKFVFNSPLNIFCTSVYNPSVLISLLMSYRPLMFSVTRLMKLASCSENISSLV